MGKRTGANKTVPQKGQTKGIIGLGQNNLPGGTHAKGTVTPLDGTSVSKNTKFVIKAEGGQWANDEERKNNVRQAPPQGQKKNQGKVEKKKLEKITLLPKGSGKKARETTKPGAK